MTTKRVWVPIDLPEMTMVKYVVVADQYGHIRQISVAGPIQVVDDAASVGPQFTGVGTVERVLMDPRATIAPSAGERWEYQVLTVQVTATAALDAELTAAGKLGWELVQFRDSRAVFKRRIP